METTEKHQVRGRPRRKAGAAATTNFSVRFTASELTAIKRAAELRGVTTAALVREAVLDRAVHITNAVGSNRAELRRMAEALEQQLDPPLRVYDRHSAAEVTYDLPDGETVEVTNTIGELRLSQKGCDSFNEMMSEPGSDWEVLAEVFPHRATLVTILRTAGTEFAPLLAEVLTEKLVSAAGYRPEVTRESLVGAAESRATESGAPTVALEPGTKSRSEATKKGGVKV